MSARHLRLVPAPANHRGAVPHSIACECPGCADERARGLLAKARKLGIRIENPRATVMVRSYTVRAHARVSKAHLGAYPKTKARLMALLKAMCRAR